MGKPLPLPCLPSHTCLCHLPCILCFLALCYHFKNRHISLPPPGRRGRVEQEEGVPHQGECSVSLALILILRRRRRKCIQITGLYRMEDMEWEEDSDDTIQVDWREEGGGGGRNIFLIIIIGHQTSCRGVAWRGACNNIYCVAVHYITLLLPAFPLAPFCGWLKTLQTDTFCWALLSLFFFLFLDRGEEERGRRRRRNLTCATRLCGTHFLHLTHHGIAWLFVPPPK